MSENKKFIKEELDQIKELREKNSSLIQQFGQLKVERLLTNQRLEKLSEAEENLHSEYTDLQQQEKDLVKKLNEKYGAGTVDIDSGEFIPAK
jgi:uncharacterized coiled-coil DUF342 family protein